MLMPMLRNVSLAFFALTLGLAGAHAQGEDRRGVDQQFQDRLHRFDPDAVAAAREYMQIFNMKQSITQAIPAMRDGMLRQIKIMNPSLDEADGKEFMDAFLKVAFVDNGDFMEKMILVLTLETFDKNELVAIRDFYKSPIGRSVLAKTPQLMGRMPEMQGIMQRYIIPEAIRAGQAKLKAKGKDLRL